MPKLVNYAKSYDSRNDSFETRGLSSCHHCYCHSEVDGYETYEEYLDSLVSEEDHHYLDDEEMARCIAELGYRSVGGAHILKGPGKPASGIRGLPYMTSVVGGGRGSPKSRQNEQNQMICDSDRGGGEKNSEKFADNIYGSLLRRTVDLSGRPATP